MSMKYYHSIFKQLHFDYGKMLWSVNHVPFFGALMSICDHRSLGSLHSITFYAFLKVLTNGKIRRKQADAIFSLIDVSSTGEVSFSEMAFWAGIIVAQKDHLEREFLYMHAWKIWVTFNETGADKITTQEFRKTGLFFDFDYPTIYHMYRDYNWDDDKHLDFERFRFYLISCIHFRALRRATGKYIRYRKFKEELLQALSIPLGKVLRYNLYPAPTSILKAVRSIKIPPIEGQEWVYHWSDVFTFNWIRTSVRRQWAVLKIELIKLVDKSKVWKWICKIFCCGLCFLGADNDCKKVEKRCIFCCTRTWNCCCLTCCCCGCCFTCVMRLRSELAGKPAKPVVIRREVELQMLAEIEDKRHLYKPKNVEFHDPQEVWRTMGEQKGRCNVQ